jgi:hypothetical protein
MKMTWFPGIAQVSPISFSFFVVVFVYHYGLMVLQHIHQLQVPAVGF